MTEVYYILGLVLVMVIVICEAVPDSHCYNYGETWSKPHP